MLNFYKTGLTNTVSIYPESSSLYFDNPSGSFQIELTQDYDQSVSTLDATLLNTPTQFSPRLTLQVTTNQVPSYTGLYSVELKEFLKSSLKWIDANTIWSQTHRKWSAKDAIIGERLLDIDRAFVSGSDVPVFKQYTTSSVEYIYESGSVDPLPKQYVSPDEQGAYITYNS
jgi:hypothetical protein